MAPAAVSYSDSTSVGEPLARSKTGDSHSLPDSASNGLNGHSSFDGELAELLAGLRSKPKQIPCSFLYDSQGTALYDQITKLDEYYPYRTELAMLNEHAEDIITHIPAGAVLVELGCGSAAKTAILQRALLARDGPEACTFVGIDVSGDFLQQAKANMLEACPGLLPQRVELVQAAYLEGLKEARELHEDEVLCILWLGSSVGNLSPDDTLTFFREMLRISGPNTEVLVCTDLWKDAATLRAAYCDGAGVTEAFIKNGTANALSAASGGRFRMRQDDWQYNVVVNAEKMQVEMYVVAGESADLGGGLTIRQDEQILIEVSRKFTTEQLRALAFNSGFYFQAQWKDPKYSIQMLAAPLLAAQLAWRDTDSLFARIVDWKEAPIDLRHPFAFYYGHVASFAKLRLVECEMPTEKDIMFSRGIDPDVADPTLCHSHPAAPARWPNRKELVEYVEEARQMLADALTRGCGMHEVNVVLEHERMHHETLYYMLAQQQKRQWQGAHPFECRRPAHKNGASLKEQATTMNGSSAPKMHSATNGTTANTANGCISGMVEIAAGRVSLGTAGGSAGGFGWDNEGPVQEAARVERFGVARRPVTIGEFRDFVLRDNGYERPELWEPEAFAVFRAAKQTCPSTWTLTADGDVWVHFPDATWNWEQVRDRPVWCSLAEAQAFCKSKGCRVMTELEYGLTVASDPHGSRLEMLQSGGWEWTSTPFAPFPGFEPTQGYEEYSTDFFDGKHFVLKGASPHTHPSASRGSFRNFYQACYPHMFAKFRCCH